MNMDYVKDFKGKMAVLFEGYHNDGCLDYDSVDNWYLISKKDACYMWAALDGAIALYNLEHPGANLHIEASTFPNSGIEKYVILQG